MGAEYKEAFALFAKKGQGARRSPTSCARSSKTTRAAIAGAPRPLKLLPLAHASEHAGWAQVSCVIPYAEFFDVMNQAGGLKPAGMAGALAPSRHSTRMLKCAPGDAYPLVQVLDKEGDPYVGTGRRRYALT